MSKLTISNLEESVVAQSNLTELSAEETTNLVGGYDFGNLAGEINVGIQGLGFLSVGVGSLTVNF